MFSNLKERKEDKVDADCAVSRNWVLYLYISQKDRLDHPYFSLDDRISIRTWWGWPMFHA